MLLNFTILFLTLATAVFAYVSVDDAERRHLIDRTDTIAAMIPKAPPRALVGEERDKESESYAVLKELLGAVRQANSDIRFIYLMGENPAGEIFFYADSEVSGSPDYSPPGQIYYEATPLMHEIFATGISTTEGPDRDRWGLWISGYAPIKDEAGKVIAAVGMDMPAYDHLKNIAAKVAVPFLAGVMVLIVLHFYRKNEEKEKRFMEQQEELLSVASHEIRSPLSGIRWALEDVMRRQSSLDEETKTAISAIYENSTRLMERTNSILSLKAAEKAPKNKKSKDRIMMRELLAEVAASLSLNAKEHKVKVSLDETLTSDIAVTANKEDLSHVFFNLLSNAIKYTRPETEVKISYENEEDRHLFAISDHGPGVAEKDQEKIFGGFYRTGEARASGEAGTGMGLYFAKKIVESEGGKIYLDPSSKEGATFVVELRA